MKKARFIRVYQGKEYKDIVCEPTRLERKGGMTGLQLAIQALQHTTPNGLGGHIFETERSGISPTGYLHNFSCEEEFEIQSLRDSVQPNRRELDDKLNDRPTEGNALF